MINAPNHRPWLGEIEDHDGYFLDGDIVPHVKFGPIDQGKDPHRLAWIDARVGNLPQLDVSASKRRKRGDRAFIFYPLA